MSDQNQSSPAPSSTSSSTSSASTSAVSRRGFVKGAAAAGVLAASLPSFVHAAENNTLKIGLIGCGGRGSGAALQALHADKNIKLVALADMFKDKLEASLGNLKASDAGDRVDVPPERQYVGFEAYKGLIPEVDVVLLATPPHFRPIHLAAAVEAGKQVFCEKPVATDAPGLRSVIESVKKAKEKNLNLVSGLCYRYDTPKIEAMQRIHDGALGQIVNIQSNYLTGGLWQNVRKEGWSDMEYQLRNWLYYTWLSGDLIVEQHIHSLDKAVWVMNNEAPVKVTATGGRACRLEPIYGNVYDHFCSIYEWANGTRCFAHARQWNNCAADVSDTIYGTEGTCNLMQHTITGKAPWRGKVGKNMYDLEHEAMYKAIRDGKVINNGDYMVTSTGMAMMGRMSAYTGKTITYEQMLNSEESLAPEKYEFGPLAFPPIAVPGKTKFA